MENNWSIEQTKRLFAYAYEAAESGRGLSWAFMKTAEEARRSVNSVRNYYYSQLKMFELVPSLAEDLGIQLKGAQRDRFELFNENEIVNLVEEILIAKGRGISVRATISKLSCGDSKLGLRLQNKYRSMVSNHRDRVTKIMNDLNARGIVYFNPYTKLLVTEREDGDNHKKLTEYIASLGADEVENVFAVMKKLFA